MKIFVKIYDADSDTDAKVIMIAANSLDEATHIMAGTKSEDEYV